MKNLARLILGSPDSVIPFAPAGPDGPSYDFRRPSYHDGVEFWAEMRALDAVRYPKLQQLEVYTGECERLLSDEEHAETREDWLNVLRGSQAKIQEIVSRAKERGGPVPAEDMKAAFEDDDEIYHIINTLREYSGKIQSMLRQMERYPRYLGPTACNMFLVGWNNIDQPFERHATGVPDSVLRAIPQTHMFEIGLFIVDLIEGPEEFKKNSDSPSTPERSPATSPAKSGRRKKLH